MSKAKNYSKADKIRIITEISELAGAGMPMHDACEKVGILYYQFYKWTNADPKLAAIYEEKGVPARLAGYYDEAHNMTTVGELRHVYHKGVVVGSYREKSPMLLARLIERYDPDFAQRSK